MAQAPRRIGATSAAGIVFDGIGADAKTRLRPRASRVSTLDTMPIISSYASLAVSPNVNSPCFSSTSPRTSVLDSYAWAADLARPNPGMTYGTIPTRSPRRSRHSDSPSG